MTMQHNIILATDSYKQTHWRMYPPGLDRIESYLEARKGAEYDEVVFFGLQYLLNTYLRGCQVTHQKIEEAERFCQDHFGQQLFNRSGWEHILHRHGGRLPVSIRAVPEGMVVPSDNVMLTITNTDPEVPWLTNHLETLLVQLWYPCTVATISREQKKALREGLVRSGSTEKLPYMLHDFGYRGSTSKESAGLGGAAHLVNFQGTDTLAGIELLRQHYYATMPGHSVPAAEHSTITSWGRSPDAETASYRHILEQYRTGLVSVVSDSYDVMAACREIWGEQLRDEVISTDRVLVVRPDSGDPTTTLLEVLDILWERFGGIVNAKGYRVLPDYLRLIQGDGITRFSLPRILESLMKREWSLDNLVFGSGGGLLQRCDRDTLRFAMKCSYAQVYGQPRDVWKEPITSKSKRSKAGLLKLIRQPNGEVSTVSIHNQSPDLLQEQFRDGDILAATTIADIRARADLPTSR